jgi:hypothetical protein
MKKEEFTENNLKLIREHVLLDVLTLTPMQVETAMLDWQSVSISSQSQNHLTLLYFTLLESAQLRDLRESHADFVLGSSSSCFLVIHKV